MTFTVRTWTKGKSDVEEKTFDTEKESIEYAEGSVLHGYLTLVQEDQPDLFKEMT